MGAATGLCVGSVGTARERTMAILIKCNASDVRAGEELSVTLPKEKRVGVIRDLEAFVWISEDPREGPKGTGLEMRGNVTSWEPADDGRTTVTVRVSERLSRGFTMNALARMAQQSEAASALHRRIHKFRHRRIWGLTPPQRDVLHEAFETLRA